jgi:bifunctional DNA-binding transcriptional regulator/antitoxin component of YhaV-PrlF toxin-antitoxin module
VRECRGLIIDKDINPVCVPFFKFGNYGESYADKIDWESAKVEEKIDGSLIKVWNYGGKWIVSTNGTIFADTASINSENEMNQETVFQNFGDLFRAALDNIGFNVESLNPQYTYMFELVSPHNRVVVPYETIDVYHIGTRDIVSLKEIEIDVGIKKPKTYECNNIDDLIEMALKLKYCEEGYVVKDKDYKRIKVKSPAYVAVQHLIAGMNEKNLLELIRKNETGEFLTYFPEYKKYVDNLSEKIENTVSYINEIIRNEIEGKTFETRKDFAAMATKTKYSAFFFLYYDGKFKNPSDWLWSMQNDKILEQIYKL